MNPDSCLVSSIGDAQVEFKKEHNRVPQFLTITQTAWRRLVEEAALLETDFEIGAMRKYRYQGMTVVFTPLTPACGWRLS